MVISLLILVLASLNLEAQTSGDFDGEQVDLLKDLLDKGSDRDLEEDFTEEKTLELKPRLRGEDEEPCEDCIFGYDLFEYAPSTFAPATYIPLPPNYTLGPGDKIKVEYFGNENDFSESFISRNGSFKLPLLGPVNLSGLTLEQAEKLISKKVSTVLMGTEVFVSLSELRSITIYVLGEAYKPGSYTVSSLSTITNVLFASGGVSRIGSLRNIQLKRGGNTIKVFDLYDLLLRGNIDSDEKLMQEDVIFIPVLQESATLEGSFNRPGRYEVKPGENIEDLFSFGGGFKVNVSNKARIELSRINENNDARIVSFFNRGDDNLRKLEIANGDNLRVSETTALTSQSVSLEGEFRFPGIYSVQDGERLLDVIERAGGYTKEAYSLGAIFTREDVAILQKESYERTADSLETAITNAVSSRDASQTIGSESLTVLYRLIKKLRETEPDGRRVIKADLSDLKSDPMHNIILRNNDVLFIPKRPTSVSVSGEVLNPSIHVFDPDLSVNGYLALSGGFSDQADKNKIYVVHPNGQSQLVEKRFFSSEIQVLPGSSIVVSRDPTPYNWLQMAGMITPVFANLALSAASIATINR